MKILLEKLYDDAADATQNPNIYRRIVKDKWHKLCYDPGNKSLAYILHVHEGWTAEGMKDVTSVFEASFFVEIIGRSPIPMIVQPLSDQESRVLWTCLRYHFKMSELTASLLFEVDLDKKLLVAPLKYHSFQKKG